MFTKIGMLASRQNALSKAIFNPIRMFSAATYGASSNSIQQDWDSFIEHNGS
jgi:hypothetical protein